MWGFCLDCGAPLKLVVGVKGRGVPHGDAGHDVVYDWTRIYVCGNCASGDYRKVSHDCWAHPTEEPWDMEWSTRISPEHMRLVLSGFSSCPNPKRQDCACSAHQFLREQNPWMRHTEIRDSRSERVG